MSLVFRGTDFFVKRFALCYRTVVLSLSNVGVLWPNGWMDPDETWHGGRPRTRPQCVRWGLSSPFQKGAQPPPSGRILDVYHTSTHGVALVRIKNAGLKCAARGLLKIQDARNRHLGTIAQLSLAISSQLRHISTIGKKTC